MDEEAESLRDKFLSEYGGKEKKRGIFITVWHHIFLPRPRNALLREWRGWWEGC